MSLEPDPLERSKEALMNNAINLCSHLLTDMGRLRCPPLGSVEKEGFAKFSRLFCDSIIFWGLYNTRTESKGAATGKYISEIRSIFNRLSLEVASIKLVQDGNVVDDEYFSDNIIESHQEGFNESSYVPGFVAIKVALDDCTGRRVVLTLANVLRAMKKKFIVLHDIDFAHDCKYITTRSHLERHLEDNGITNIVDDRRKVGDYCISWRGSKKRKNIRYKVYNKFVQLLESAEVRKSLGSRMEELVERGGKFSKRLKRYRKYGYTRIELTFYGSKLLSLEDYKNRMEETKNMLADCTTFKCSFEEQWRQRAENISSMMAVYFPNEKYFAYCHWWNSITSKKYGYMWTNIPKNSVHQLVSNYSFNDRPIYYVEARVEGECLIISEEKTYERVHGCTAITMVAGGSKGMYPSQDSFDEGVREFSEMGIVEVNNITIGWPERRHNARSAPVAELVEKEDDNIGYIKRLRSINPSVYTSGYSCLVNRRHYTIIAAGCMEYRGEMQWHFITKCGLRLRAGKSLTKAWNEWKQRFADESGYLESLTDVKWMEFVTRGNTRSRGTRDIVCILVV
jgi:hypothetical protein